MSSEKRPPGSELLERRAEQLSQAVESTEAATEDALVVLDGADCWTTAASTPEGHGHPLETGPSDSFLRRLKGTER